MVRVSGRLLDFVEDPSQVAEVQVWAKRVSPHGDGLMTDHPVTVDWDPDTGTVSFDAAAETIGVISWVSVGRTHPSEGLPLVVPDKAEATLREVVEAAMLADAGTITELQRLALEVTDKVATITNITMLEEWADSAKQDATTATSAATAAQEIATTLPTTIQTELDTRIPPLVEPMVPPLVADAIADDRAVADAAAAAAGPAVAAAAESIKWRRGDIANGTNLNAVQAPGLYTILTWAIASSLPNRPEGNAINRATLEVKSLPSGETHQVWTTLTGADLDAPIMSRRRDLNGAWTPWERIDEKWDKGPLAAGTDLNNVITPGSYSVRGYAVASTLVNRPLDTQAWDHASLEVTSASSNGRTQTWRTMPNAARTSLTLTRHRDSDGVWSPWTPWPGAAISEGDIAGKANTTYVDQQDQALGQRITDEKWDKGPLAAGVDLDSIITPGSYGIRSYSVAAGLTNRPPVPEAWDHASLEVTSASSRGRTQTWRTTPVATKKSLTFTRHRDSDGVWSPWTTPPEGGGGGGLAWTQEQLEAEIRAAAYLKSAIAQNTDLNTVTTSGLYRIPTYSVANSLTNAPTSHDDRMAVSGATLEVKQLANGAAEQRWTTLNGASQRSPILVRRRDNDGNWTPWEPQYSLTSPLEPAGLAMHGLVGESTAMRAILLGLSGSTMPHPAGWYGGPGELLTIPTHEGSGQACHPAVLHFPSGWNGYRYWMAMTPYAWGQERWEDPDIVASHDGTTWVVPDGLTNPLDDQAGKPDPYNSDTHLLMVGGTMVCIWRMVDRPNGRNVILYYRTSTDGVIWTPKQELWRADVAGVTGFVSPALVQVPGGWRLYGVRETSQTNELAYFSSTSTGLPTINDWGQIVVTDIGDFGTNGRDPWHGEVQRVSEGDWVAVVCAGDFGTASYNGDLHLGLSVDGDNWKFSPLPLMPRVTGWSDTMYKAGFVVHGDGDRREIEVFYSGYESATSRWGIGRALAAPLSPITL